jgi:periplasmic divalent cation tolerance protein
MRICLCYITASSSDEAMRIGRQLLEERLAACINVFDGMRSLYWWDGKIEEGHEAVLIAKTRSDLVASLIARVGTLHSYAVPCVLEIPVEGGNPSYISWLEGELPFKL